MAEKPTAPSRGARGATGKTGATGRAGKDAASPDAYLAKADQLQEALDAVRREIVHQTDEIEAANRTADDANQSAIRSRWASRFAVGAAVISLVACFFVWQQNVKVEKQNDAIIAARTEARYTTCLRENSIRYDAGQAAAKKAQDFIDSNQRFYKLPKSTGERLQAEIDYVNSQRQVTLDSYPRRDCTEAGIDAFYKNPPPPPPGPPCVPDGKGSCK